MTPSPMEPMGLAVVTGASSGIGLALAKELVRRAFDVVIAADEDAIHDAAAELEPSGRLVVPIQVDLASPEGVVELYREVRAMNRPLDVVALNAGVGVSGAFAETDLETHLRLIDLNVRSTVHLAGLVVRDMVARGAGRILLTSSIVASAPMPYQSTYGASKAFGHSFAEAIRHELKDSGVTVTSLMPGPTDTDFFSRSRMEDTRVAQGPKDDPEEVAQDALDGLFAGKASVVAGSLRNRIQTELSTHLPDAVTAPLMSTMTKPQDDGG